MSTLGSNYPPAGLSIYLAYFSTWTNEADYVKPRYLCILLTGFAVILTGLGHAQPAALTGRSRLPGPAKVGIGRADRLYLPPSVFAPSYLYPHGKIDYKAMQTMVDRAVQAFSEQPAEEFWHQLFAPAERVGLMVDVQEPQMPTELVEAIIRQLVKAGLRPENILIFAGDERDLFTAGFSLRHHRPVKCYGAESAGYRGGISRVVLDMCDVIINIACLRPDAQFGMTGAIFNHLACVPHSQRLHLHSQPQQLASAAARPLIRRRTRLHFLAALHPHYALPTSDRPEPRWEYTALLVSTDPVAVDTIARSILETKRHQEAMQPWALDPPPDYLQAACNEYHLGQSDPALITVTLSGPQDGSLLAVEAGEQ